MNKDNRGIVFAREHADSPETQINILKPNTNLNASTMPEIIPFIKSQN